MNIIANNINSYNPCAWSIFPFLLKIIFNNVFDFSVNKSFSFLLSALVSFPFCHLDTGVILEEGTSPEKMSVSDWPVGKSLCQSTISTPSQFWPVFITTIESKLRH